MKIYSGSDFRHSLRMRNVTNWMVAFSFSERELCALTSNCDGYAESLRDVREFIAELESLVHGPLDIRAADEIHIEFEIIERFFDIGP